MQKQATTRAFDAPDASGTDGPRSGQGKRERMRDAALRRAMAKRCVGAPTYSVPEAAVLLSISNEYLYRLIQVGSFPGTRLRHAGSQGRYVVPASAVEPLLGRAAVAEVSAATQVDVDEQPDDCPGGAA